MYFILFKCYQGFFFFINFLFFRKAALLLVTLFFCRRLFFKQMKKLDSCSFSCVLTRKKGDISLIYFELKNAENVCASFFLSVPAKIVNISADISVNEGSNVNLFCLAVGRPEPTITWRHLKCKCCREMS